MNPRALGSRYLLEDRIGQGGMGVVWRGRDRESGAGFAIKVLRAEYAGDPGSVARFVRERTALVRFRHPNVVTLHDMIVEGDQLALVMDLVGGGDLEAYRQGGGGVLSAGEACGLVAQVCDGLAAAHAAGIVHRDLKPANVLLDGGQVRLADFGIARIVGESPATTTGTVIGTAPYLAPEAISGQEPAAAGDVYAAGVTLYELLAGQPPFTGQIAAVMHDHLATAPPRPAGVRDRLWELISGCLSKDPAARPTAAALALALRDPALLRDADSVPDAGPLLGAGPARSADPAPGAGAPTNEVPPFLGLAPGPGSATESQRLPLSAAVTAEDPARPGGMGSGPAGPESASARTGPGSRRVAVRPAWVAGAAALVLAGTTAAAAITHYSGSGSGRPGAGGATRAATDRNQVGSLTIQTASPSHSPVTSAGASARTSPSAGPGQVASRVTGPPSAVASASAPAATTGTSLTWHCGLAEAATLWSTGAATGQTLQACIRADDGHLDLKGILTGTTAAWQEQIVLVLKNSAQANYGTYSSPVCTTSQCTYTVTVTPGSGSWTILPKWERYNGFYQSTGHEPGLVSS